MNRRTRKNKLQEELQKELQERSRKWMRVTLLSIVILVGVAITSLAYIKLTDENTLPLRVVKIDGDFYYLDTQQLKTLLSQQLNKNYLLVDIEGLYKQVKAVPWVDHVSIRRKWPDTLMLEIQEQQPLARWGKGGLVNQRGEWFAAAFNHAAESLPELDGPDGTAAMLSGEFIYINSILKQTGLQASRLSMTHRRSWKLDLGNGLSLQLGRMDMHARLQRFMKIYQQIVANQLEKIESVDMRYTNGFAVRWKPGSEIENNKGDHKDA